MAAAAEHCTDDFEKEQVEITRVKKAQSRNLGVRTNFDAKNDKGRRLVLTLGGCHLRRVHDGRLQPAPGGGRAARNCALQYRWCLKSTYTHLTILKGSSDPLP